MRYSKKRRYRKKQRGGNETKTEFSYPESDMAYAQIYSLIKNEALRKSVIEEMTKGDEILFTSRDLAPKISPGIMDIKLYDIVVETAEKEVYNVNPELAPGGTPTSIASYTSETFKDTILDKNYGSDQISVYYKNPDNLFLRHLIDAFYNSAEKTLAPSLQEKSFLKELFTDADNQHTYIDRIFSSNGGTNGKIELVVNNTHVYSIVFKNLAGITGAKLADLDKLKGLKKITIQDDITKYSAIKSPTVEDVIIETDTLTKSDHLLFLGGCPVLKTITIKSKDLKGNIVDVLNKLPSGESKNMVDLKGSYALTFGDINDLVKVIKDKKITGIAFPNQMSQFISTNNATLSEALKPIFLKSVFGQSVTVSTEKINDTLIEQYSELVKLFPTGFKIEEAPGGSDMKYTISEGTVMGGQPICELITTMGDETKNSRKLKTITFKKGMTKVVLNGFDYLTQVSIDYDVELTEINITDCKNAGFHLEFSKTENVGIVSTSQPTLTSIVITGCDGTIGVAAPAVGVAAPAPVKAAMSMEKLDALTSVDIDWPKMDFLSLIDCKNLKTVSLPRSLTQLIITNAPITNTEFLKPLIGLTNIVLSGCSKFKSLTLPEELVGTPKKDTINKLNLDGCASLTNLNLDGYSKLQTLSVNPPDAAASSVAASLSSKLSSGDSSSITSTSNEMSLNTVNINGCIALDTLSISPSVDNLVINNASKLSDTNFLSGLNLLKQLTIQQCPLITNIDCKPFAQIIETLNIDNCADLNSISGLDDVPKLTSFTTNVVPKLKQLSLDNCAVLDKVNIQNVERLVLKGCAALKSNTIVLPDSLLSLEISGTGLDNLDFLYNLKQTLDSLKLDLNIADIALNEFKSLSAIEIKGNITTDVTILGCEKLSYIGKMPSKLQSLSIKGSSITSTRFLKDLNALESLTITQTQKYAVSDSLPATLTTLIFENSSIDSTKTIFNSAINLETVKIISDDTLADIGLSILVNLITLELKQCTSLTIKEVSNLPKLTAIDIDAGAFIEFTIKACNALDSINLPKTLTGLTIESNITGFDFTGLTALEAFTIKDNDPVKEVSVAVPPVVAPVVGVPAVVDPNVHPGPNITKAYAGKIIIPTRVKKLLLEKNKAMATITNMNELASTLETLTIDNCETLITDLMFDGFVNLFHLNIDKCKSVKIIDVKNCVNCSSLTGLTYMTALEIIMLDLTIKASVYFEIDNVNSLLIKGKDTITINTKKDNINVNSNIVIEGCIFTNPNITLSGTMDRAVLNNCKSIDAVAKVIPINLTIKDSTKLNTFGLTNVDMGKIHVSNCALLKNFPQITGMPNLTELVLKDLPIEQLIVSACPALTTVSHDNCDAITNMSFTNVGLKMIDILKKPTLETVSINGCIGLTDLTVRENTVLTTVSIDGCEFITEMTVRENPLLTTLTMKDLKALNTLNVNTNGNNLKILDFAGVPNVNKLDIHSNKGLIDLQNINALKTCSTYYLNNNAINTTLDKIIDLLDGTMDKTVVLDDNPAITITNVDDMIKNIGAKKVIGLYAANKTGIDPNQPTIYNYYRGLNLSQTSRVNTNFINTVGGAVYSGKQMSDIFFLQTILAIPDTDAEIKNINTLINDVSKTDKKYDYNNSSATFTLDPTDGFRITKLVLYGTQISFANVRQLEQLKSLTIQNNNVVNNEFNNSNPKVLPDGLEELVILGCPNFQLVNLDNLKGTLKLFQNNNQNNMFRFEDFPNLITVQLGPLNNSTINFIRCPNLADVSLDASTHTIEIVESPKFPVISLETMTKIEKLTLEAQTMVFTTTIQSKIEGLILKNMPTTFTELNGDYTVLKILEIDNCAQLTIIDVVAPKLESMKIGAHTGLTSLNVYAAAAAAAAGNSFNGLTNLKSLEIESDNITELVIEGCPMLGSTKNGQFVNHTVVLPTSLTTLNINGDGNFEQAIHLLGNLKTFNMDYNVNTTKITLPAEITECSITNSSDINHLNTERCKATLTNLVVANCTTLSTLGNDIQETISFTGYSALTTLTVQNSLCTKVILSDCLNLNSLNLNNNNHITEYTVNQLSTITELTIPDTVTSVKVEQMMNLNTITYAGTTMTSFNVDNCQTLNTIPDFKTNVVNMTLLKVSNCPQINVELVAYLNGVGGVPVGVPGGSKKNKSRKVSGGMNNKSRRNKRLLRGGADDSIAEVNFSDTIAIVNSVPELINVIANKKIQKMFVPELVKTKIETAKSSNAFIDALKVQNTANPLINIGEITNVEITPEESYNKRRNAIIAGLTGVFTEIARQAKNTADRVEAERVAEQERLAKIEADRVEAERVAEQERLAKIEADRVEAERVAEQERLAKIEADKLEAERVAEVERLAKIEADRVEAERVAEEQRLAKIEADRVEAARVAEQERLAKIKADRVEAERVAEEERLAKIEADRVEAEQERLAKEQAERVAEQERLAKEQADRVEAEKVAVDKSAKEKATEGIKILFSGPLFECINKAFSQRECDSTKRSSIGTLKEKDGIISLIIVSKRNAKEESKTYENIVYAVPDTNVNNPEQHFVLHYYKDTILSSDVFLKAPVPTGVEIQKGSTSYRDNWIVAINANTKPLYKCSYNTGNTLSGKGTRMNPKCSTDTFGFVIHTSSGAQLTLFKNNNYIKEITYSDITDVKNSQNIVSKNNELIITHKKSNSPPETITLQTTDKNMRDWWVKRIEKMIPKQSDGKQSVGKRGGNKQSDGKQSVGNYVALSEATNKQSDGKQSDGKQSDGKRSDGNYVALSEATNKRGGSKQSVGKQGGKGFRATRKKIRRKPKEPVTK